MQNRIMYDANRPWISTSYPEDDFFYVMLCYKKNKDYGGNYERKRYYCKVNDSGKSSAA